MSKDTENKLLIAKSKEGGNNGNKIKEKKKMNREMDACFYQNRTVHYTRNYCIQMPLQRKKYHYSLFFPLLNCPGAYVFPALPSFAHLG